MSVTKDVTSGKRKTVFLVVHGVGQHEKYETLACFAAGMIRSLQLDATPERVLVPFDDGVESALTLQTHAHHIDILEYYYQPYLQRVVKTSDVIGFVFRTINCVKGLYKKYDFDSDGAAGEQNAAQKKRPDEDLIVWHYLINRPATLPSKLVSWTLRGIYFVWSRMPNFLQKPFEWLASFFVERYVTEVLGDLVAYLAIDPKSRLNGKRREILSGCEKRIKELLSRMGEAGYDQVVVAGHSLGSVVAYDALSRIARDASCGRFSVAACDKLAGFLTFGSPLDKVAFVFWPSSNDVLERGGNEWERLQKNLYTGLLPHFYGIRCSAALELKSDVAQPESRLFRNIKWVNYYSDHDLIAGHLDAYEGVENRRLGEPDRGLDILKAFSDHGVYWGSTEMFDGVITDFLAGATTSSASPRSTHSRQPQSGSPKINHFFDDKRRPLILGHRGVPLLHQENTLAGLRKAVELGIDGVEFDVFKTRDDKIVVFHDEETERLTGVKGTITEMTWDEVSRLRIKKRIDMGEGRVVTYPSEERIPLLEEVLEEFKGKLLMNIEMKAYAPNWGRRHTGTETARIIHNCAAQNSVIVTSFDFFMLYCLEQEYPGLHSGFAYDDGMVDNAIGEWFQKIPEIATDFAKAPGNQNDISFLNFVLEANTVGEAIGSTLVDVEHSLIDTDTVDKFKAKNMLVGSYTVFPLDTRFVRNRDEDPHDVVWRMMERRVDWLETDDPVRLLELYASKAL